MSKQTMNELYTLVKDRFDNPTPESYSNYLFTKGRDKILKKLGEENTEIILGAKNTKDELVFETADYLYHLMVLLVSEGVSLDDIETELGKRFGTQSRLKERDDIATY